MLPIKHSKEPLCKGLKAHSTTFSMQHLGQLKLLNPQSAIRNSRLRRGFSGGANGVALVMVLWVITALSVIVFEFCFAMRTEVNITKNYKVELQLYGMAEGGIQRAIAELIYKHDPKVQEMRKAIRPEEIPPEKMEWMTDGRAYVLPFDQGLCEVMVMSEAGKININVASEAMLRKVIKNLALEGEDKDIVVDSIMDWRDPDDFYRINGAENDYYQSLKEPYNCKNGPLDSVEELLLIRGITPDLFHGRKGVKKEEGGQKVDRIGLKNLFSIYSPGEQIDINSASPLVMRFALGIPDEVSKLIVKAREEKAFENQQDLIKRVPELSPFIGDIGRFIVYRSTTSYYTIESKAKNEEGAFRRIKVIVKIDPREKAGYKIIQWIDTLQG